MYAYKALKKEKSTFREKPKPKTAVHNNRFSADPDTGIEEGACFGLSGVRVCFGASNPEQLNTHAFTRSSNSHGLEQKAQPSHEPPHTVQQMRSSVKPTSHVHKTDIIQREKLTQVVREADPSRSPLSPNPKPTIIFESMTSKEDEVQSVYDQTKRYSGNTICVVGLNRQVDDFSDTSPRMNNGMDIDITGTPAHILKCFEFIWKRPSEVASGAQYKMPFVEARLEVMRQAKNLAENLPEEENVDDGDLSHSFVYRWIDGDAKDDNSNDLADDTLQSLVNDQMFILSGSYGWRSSADSSKYTAYAQFIQKINDFEKEVRRLYFEYKGVLEGQNGAMQELPHFLPRGAINGYYLPETTLMLSNTAHNMIIDSIQIPETPGRDQFLGGKEQTKESMRMLELSGFSREAGLVRHSDTLRVTKPLKNEFADTAGSTPCYLGEDFLAALKSGILISRDKFEQHLKQMRQSVPNMFNINDDSYKAGVSALIDRLHTYYCAKRIDISNDINSILRQRQLEARRTSGKKSSRKK